MDPVNQSFEQWIDENVHYIRPDELRSRDAVTAAVFLKDRLNVAFRAGYEANTAHLKVPPKSDSEDVLVLRLQLQAEVAQAKAQLRTLEIAYRSLEQDNIRLGVEVAAARGQSDSWERGYYRELSKRKELEKKLNGDDE